MNRDETPQRYTQRILSFVGDREPWQVLGSTAGRLRELVRGHTAEELRKQEPSRWSPVQILAHLADSEIVAGWRFRSILACDGVPLQPYDQDAWAATLRYADTDPEESLEIFEVNRRGNLSVLKRIDRTLLANHGKHAERGPETVEHMVRLYAGHDLNHLSQLERLLAT